MARRWHDSSPHPSDQGVHAFHLDMNKITMAVLQALQALQALQDEQVPLPLSRASRSAHDHWGDEEVDGEGNAHGL